MRAARYLTEWQFDRKYGMQTRGRHFTNAAHELHGERRPYQPVPLGRMVRIINSLKLQTKDYWFVDLGSGMGGALVAAARMGFRGLVGVEFDGTLHQIANGNIASLGLRDPELASRITLLHQDASGYEFPVDAPLLVFMFNPFGPNIMRTVMGNLAKNLRVTPRKAFIVYYFPTQGTVVEEISGFSTVHRNERYAVYEYSPRRIE
jgi:predicted RNA methylase